jgi:DNA mismatch repair ATPase MutS
MNCENNTKLEEDINDYFKFPIYYNDKKVQLKENVIKDLELISTIDTSSNSISSYYFNTQNINEFAKNISNQVSQYYTTDIDFLKENQILLKEYQKIDEKYIHIDKNYSNIIEIWKEIKEDTGFKEKYQYVDWSIFEFLNHSEYFLQIMSLYNIVSPVISFLVPIIILIIPFFVIRLKGLVLTIEEYIDVLKIVAQSHALGKLFTKFNEVNMNEKIYFMVSAAFYLFSIYQNILICIRFNHNMVKIHKYFKDIEFYLDYTIQSMDHYLTYSSNLETQKEFSNVINNNKEILIEFKQKLLIVSQYKFTNFKKLFEIGHILKSFYQLYNNKKYNDAFMYSFGFNGYIDLLEGLIINIENKQINFCEFINENKKIVFKNSYYACLKDNNPVKNNIKLNKNLIITGPNASGKTTILKSTLINIIFSQQFGCGFYDSAKIKPFDFLHCYLNIPDTSGRDSLFQAEARRCKEILDVIENSKDQSHFCLFDELYSGTNPEEAILSAVSFMNYLIKNKNVSCLLTTHFIKVCKKLKKNKNIINYHMVANKNNNKISYTYLFKEGISEVKGGINVLSDMNYPKEIIDNTIS